MPPPLDALTGDHSRHFAGRPVVCNAKSEYQLAGWAAPPTKILVGKELVEHTLWLRRAKQGFAVSVLRFVVGFPFGRLR